MSGLGSSPRPSIVAEMDARRIERVQPFGRAIVCLAIGRAAATLELVRLAGPFVDRVDGLADEHRQPVIGLDHEGLMPGV